MKRREFLLTAAATLAASAFANPRFLYADGNTRENILLVFLRGGADPLTMFPQVNSDVYNKLYVGNNASRPGLKNIDTPLKQGNSVLEIFPDKNVGINKHFKPLLDAVKKGNSYQLRAVMPLGITYSNGLIKSHADCQQAAITGDSGLHLASAYGMLSEVHNRYNLGLLNTVGLGGNPTRELYDQKKDGTILNLRRFKNYTSTPRKNFSFACSDFNKTASIQADNKLLQSTMQRMQLLEHGGGKFKDAFQAAHDKLDVSLKLVQQYINTVELPESTNYGNTGFGGVCQDVARYFSAVFPATASVHPKTRIAQIDLMSFDSHKDQEGVLADKFTELSNGLAGLITDLKDKGQWDNTSILVFSEFGRAVKENGGAGTDHGWGSAAMVLSGKFNTSKLIGEIRLADLDDAHIKPTLSYHSPMNEVFLQAGISLDDIVDEALRTQTRNGAKIIERIGLFT